ncbi:MAG TPA: oxidoreductase [Chitinophagaceae bacterium]|nr:oxidoreductase [Chitinophagaceae bacterium]
MSNRRDFIRNLGGSAIAITAASLQDLAARERQEILLESAQRNYTANDHIRVAVIGFGIIGYRNTQTFMQLPGVELAAICDLYDGRLARAKELYGQSLITTRDYRELINRKDIDAIIVCTSDNWHDAISIDAMRAGKAVYCEKPVVHQLHQGQALLKVQQETGALLQVGSQRVSSIAYAKAKELYQAGEIGQLNSVEAAFDRQSVLGAWKYTMPTDASPETVDWKRYQRGKQQDTFDAKKFFWWRNYKEYGTGVAGDLFVHLLSGLHFLTESLGPSRIFATGDLCYWKDGRNVPDVMTAVLEYPDTPQHKAFQVTLRVNLISGMGDTATTRFVGTEGVLNFGWNDFTIQRSKMPKAPGLGGWDSLDTYPAVMQAQIRKEYDARFSAEDKAAPVLSPIRYAAPAGYSDSKDHFANFFASVRKQLPVVEDAAFGFRAAAPCLACNESYFQQKVIYWDPQQMQVRKA